MASWRRWQLRATGGSASICGIRRRKIGRWMMECGHCYATGLSAPVITTLKRVTRRYTLNNRKYTVDFITGRALREMEPAAKMYSRIVALSNAALKGESPQDAKELSIGEAMDVMIRWFCILFGNQFTPDDVLDHYPVDRLMHDIALALMAVQTQTTSILDEFPTKAAKTEAQAATA